MKSWGYLCIKEDRCIVCKGGKIIMPKLNPMSAGRFNFIF